MREGANQQLWDTVYGLLSTGQRAVLDSLLTVPAGARVSELDRLRRLLETLRRGARPATREQALTARQAVVTVSARCAGEGCLQRSLATVLLCRARGTWPTWCTGVRSDPFRAHAWIEVDGEPVGEPPSAALFHRILTVPTPPTPGRTLTVPNGQGDSSQAEPRPR